MKQFLIGFFASIGFLTAFAEEPKPLLVPDYDRDGVILAADRDKALAGEKFTIWLNDDDDDDGTDSGAEAGDTNTDLHDVPGGNDDMDFVDDHVNGRCDLLDFFPVLIDVNGVESPGDYTWKLSSKSVNVVFTQLKADTAGDFHTKEAKALDGETPLYRAEVTNLTEGVALPNGFLVNGRGVFLIEGAALADGGITLRGEREGSDPVEVTLDLRVVDVEKMYGWMNLRPEAAVSSKPPYQPPAVSSKPPYQPPAISQPSQPSQRHFILVHGYNTNHDEARGNAAEFYKKLWQSGSDAMMTAVEWRGDQSQIKFGEIIPGLPTFTPNYHVNVENAFLAARPFADACKKLPGEKILVGHSLGNMLISSAIKDYGLDYTKYVMLNAAVPCEAYDASAYDEDMVDDDWLDDKAKVQDEGEGKGSLTNHLDRASRWYRNFADHKYDPYEYRRKLAWRGRFANLPRTVNYYSPTDNILLNPDPNDPDPDEVFKRDDPDICRKVEGLLVAKLVNGRSIGRGGSKKTGFGFWSFSEKMKGTWLLDVVNDVLTNMLGVAQADAYKREGGWGENDDYDPEKPFDPANTRFTPFLDERMKTRGMLDILPAETERLRAQHLADAIPAESFAAGANEVATVENVNEESFIDGNPDWPLYEGEEKHTNLWNHSAFREVAFYHTSKFYTSLAAVGKPRVIIDTDLGSSMDDLFTIDLAARMHKAGKLDLMAVMIDRPDYSDDEHKGEFLTFADRYLASLGFGDLPLGKSMPLAVERTPQHVFNPYWTLIYSNNVTGVGALMPTNRTDAQLLSCTNAVVLYRRLLHDLPEGQKIVICSTGFLTNLKALIESGLDYEGDGIGFTGLELVAAKVKELRIMGGCFDPAVAPEETGGAEYNVVGDSVAAKKVFELWPSPVVVSPWEVGLKLEYPSKDVFADFPAGTFDPVVRAAYTYWPDPGPDAMNRLWDPMTVLPLTEGETLVPLSEKGGISVDEATGVTTFVPDPSSNRCYQVASNMNATAVMNRFREICRTGNPSLPDAVRCIKDAGVDYNGHDLTFKVPKFSLGAYNSNDVHMVFAFDGKSYAPDEVTYDPVLDVFSVHFTVPKEDATAGNFYNGALTITLDNEKLGPNVVKVVPTQIVQGAIDSDNPEVWFYETNLEAPTNYVPVEVGKGDMPERRTATVQTTFTFEAATPETDEPPDGEAQAAVRIVEDAERGSYKFQYYAFVANTNGYCYRKWHDFNVGNETEVRPVVGNPYIVQMEGRYLEDSRREINTLAISVKDGYNDVFHKQFVGNLVNADGGIGGTTRLNSVEFTGDGVIETLDGVYSVNRVNANLARVDGVEYSDIAAAVAAANGKDVWLLHAASWKPTAANIGKPVKFINKGDLVLDLSDLPLGTRGVWKNVSGNTGTLTLVEGLPVGVCSWTWHASMTNVLAQMAADGRYNGMQLALAPWLGIDSMSLYFGDQEGKEVWDFIKRKIASGELNVMSTMINFPKEDYSTLHSISNTQGYMYGVATNAPDQAEQWAANLRYTAEAAKLTAELGVKTLTTESGFICINENLMYDRVSNICEVCKSYGVDFLIESGPQHSQYMTNLLTRLNAAGIKNVGVNFDPGDTALFGSEDPAESYKAMKPWIRMVHAKDCKANRASWNEDCVWGDGYVSGLDFGGSRTFLNAVKEDFTNSVNILYERLSGDATLTVKRQGEITLAMDRIFAALEEAEGTADNPWAVGAPGNAVLAYTNGTTLVVEGRGAMKDFMAEDLTPWGTNISAVDFGAQVTSIGANAFAGCSALTTLTMRGNPPALGEGNDLAGKTSVIREDALAKFVDDPDWNACAAKFESVPVCYDYANVKTLAPFLHEVWYSDYTFDEKGETLGGVEMFSCSSVRNGNFIGRNFDFFLDDKPEFAVHVAANPEKGRLASVGMAMHTGMREDGVTNGQYTASYDLVPNRMLDGINEKGVAINQNVVAYDPEVVAGAGKEFAGTNPGAPDLNISFVTRMVLDRATNAAHAVELIKSRNLFGMSVSGDFLHYMISDPKETYVVEIITNTVVARHMKVMTNFNLNWDNEHARAVTDADTNDCCWTAGWYPEPSNLVVKAGNFDAATNALAKYYAQHAEGVERFVRLRDNYDEGATFDGMVTLMQRAQYSQSSYFEKAQPYWYSDRCSVELDNELVEAGYPEIANTHMLYGIKYWTELDLDGFLDEYFMAHERECLEHKDDHRKDNCGVWLTVHNTTYDIEKRMFRIAVQEDYAHTFDIYLVESVPVTPGVPVGPFDTADAASNAMKKAVFTPSAEVAAVLTTDDVRAKYESEFGFAVAQRAGEKPGWYVEAALTAAGSNDLARSVNTVTTNINLVAITALVGDAVTSMTLTGGITGFYYSLYVGDAVTNIAPDANKKNLDVLCGEEEIGEVTFPEVKKPSDAAGFFSIGVSERPEGK